METNRRYFHPVERVDDGRSGVRRFCRKGHDKFTPHGGYERCHKDQLLPYLRCAVCERAVKRRAREKMRNKRQHFVVFFIAILLQRQAAVYRMNVSGVRRDHEIIGVRDPEDGMDDLIPDGKLAKDAIAKIEG